MPIALVDTPDHFFVGKTHVFVACRSISQTLAEDGAIDQATAAMLERLALRGIIRSAQAGRIEFWQALLLVDELPALLTRKNAALDEVTDICRTLISQLMDYYCTVNKWDKYALLERALNLINVADSRAPDK